VAKKRAQHDPQRERRRRLCRFALALSDIHASTQACDLMLTERPDMGDPHYWAYHTAIVAAYGRPFTENKPLGRVPASRLLGTLTQGQRELHEEILENRHTVAAHSDLQARPVYYMPKGAKIGETGMRSEGGGFVTSNMGWTFDRWERVKKLTMIVGAWVQAEAMEAADLIYGPNFYAPEMIAVDCK
jgi:hypothetical protein